MEIQHFYRADQHRRKKEGMQAYKYWYKPTNTKEAYEVYVEDNIPILEEWSGCSFESILFDSDFCIGKGNVEQTFRERILNHKHLYFIVIDDELNVFGHYHNTTIDSLNCMICDKDIFMFSLNNNKRGGVKKFRRRSDVDIHTSVFDGNKSKFQYYLCISSSKQSWYGVVQLKYGNGL